MRRLGNLNYVAYSSTTALESFQVGWSKGIIAIFPRIIHTVVKSLDYEGTTCM